MSANHNDETRGVKGECPYLSKKFDDLIDEVELGDYKCKLKKNLENRQKSTQITKFEQRKAFTDLGQAINLRGGTRLLWYGLPSVVQPQSTLVFVADSTASAQTGHQNLSARWLLS